MSEFNVNLDFNTIKEIGQEGRNSKVYLSYDKQLDGEIVTKHIVKDPKATPDIYFKEARLLYANDHNNIVKVNYACQNENTVIIAMPYYKNGSLKKRISDNNFLTIREVIRYAIQFLSGLNHIHAKGLIHFDIKPDNILISDSNEAMLSDFGLAKYVDPSGFTRNDFAYTPHVSPEQIMDMYQTTKNDIYQVGITLYRMVNGNTLFYKQIPTEPKELANKIINGTFPNRNIYLPHVPKKLRKIINKCISPNPADRYDNVLQIINELSQIDENLDWRFEPTPTDDYWTKQLDRCSVKVKVSKTKDSKYNIETSKDYISRVTKDHKHSYNGIEPKDTDKKLISIFASI